MNAIRKYILKQRYLKARAIIDRFDMSCGEYLARHISPELDKAYAEIDAIAAETKKAIEQERRV